VAEGVLGAEFILGEYLNAIPGLSEMLVSFLDAIRKKGMLHVAGEIV
jgi:hypothetical protein